MRSTVIIEKKQNKYYATVSGQFGGGYINARAGLTAEDAASFAAREMIRYAVSNDEGGDLLAPAEILNIVPQHLHSIDAKSKIDN
jgi:hypothetical protein